MRLGVLVGVTAAAVTPAFAQRAPRIEPVAVPAVADRTADRGIVRATDPTLEVALGERWHDVPSRPRLRLSVQITDELTELGNLIGTSMNELSDDIVGLTFDGRRRRAKLRLGTGEGALLRFRLDSDWHFTQGRARIVARLQLGIGDRQWNVELPDMEMAPTSYRGDRGVEIRIPFFERRW